MKTFWYHNCIIIKMFCFSDLVSYAVNIVAFYICK